MNLSHIWYSTNNLYERFDLGPISVPPLQRQRFLNEEMLELIQASTTLEVLEHVQAAPEDIIDTRIGLIEEAADVFVTVIGLLQGHGITLETLEAACAHKCAKNDAKTETNGYAYRDGKIRKIVDGR